MTNEKNIVIDNGESSWSDLWKKEDYWAVWLGFALLIFAIYVFIYNAPQNYEETITLSNIVIEQEAQKAPFKTIAYIEAQNIKKSILGEKLPIAQIIKNFLKKPSSWSNDLLSSFYLSKEASIEINNSKKEKILAAQETLQQTYQFAQLAEKKAASENYQNSELNNEATSAINTWQKADSAYKKISKKTSAYNIFLSLPILCIIFIILFSIGIFFMGKNVFKFALGFIGVFSIAIIAMCMGAQSTMKYYGIGVEPWAIIIGIIIANTIGTPKWIKPALEVEYFIKTGLVLLGAEILLDKIIAIGIPGIFVTWVVTPIILISTYIFGQKILKMSSPTLNIVISADMSVCGTSAAIATASACRAKKEELTLALGLSLTFTAIMMIIMPAFIKAVGMPEVLGGAWIGGTIDATGAVAAAGAVLGSKAMYVAATIKMIQNILIGVTAFGVAVYWCMSVERTGGRTVGVMEIWHRFPKFVIGFLVASIIFSIYSTNLGPDLSSTLISKGVINGFEKDIRTWFFVLAFAAIGLSTNFRELTHYLKGGKPLTLYVCGQSLNLLITLAMAYLMFYIIFPEITAKI